MTAFFSGIMFSISAVTAPACLSPARDKESEKLSPDHKSQAHISALSCPVYRLIQKDLYNAAT